MTIISFFNGLGSIFIGVGIFLMGVLFIDLWTNCKSTTNFIFFIGLGGILSVVSGAIITKGASLLIFGG